MIDHVLVQNSRWFGNNLHQNCIEGINDEPLTHSEVDIYMACCARAL